MTDDRQNHESDLSSTATAEPPAEERPEGGESGAALSAAPAPDEERTEPAETAAPGEGEAVRAEASVDEGEQGTVEAAGGEGGAEAAAQTAGDEEDEPLAAVGEVAGREEAQAAAEVAEAPTGDEPQAAEAGAQATAPDGGGERADEPQAAEAEPQAAEAEPQAAVAEPQTAVAEPQTAVAEPQTAVAEPQTAEAEPQTAEAEPQAAEIEPTAAHATAEAAAPAGEDETAPAAVQAAETAAQPAVAAEPEAATATDEAAAELADAAEPQAAATATEASDDAEPQSAATATQQPEPEAAEPQAAAAATEQREPEAAAPQAAAAAAEQPELPVAEPQATDTAVEPPAAEVSAPQAAAAIPAGEAAAEPPQPPPSQPEAGASPATEGETSAAAAEPATPQAEASASPTATGEAAAPPAEAAASQPAAAPPAAAAAQATEPSSQQAAAAPEVAAAEPEEPEDPALAALREAREKGTPVEGRVIGWNRGGFHVVVGEVTAFCPSSEMEVGRPKSPQSYVEKSFQFKVIKYQKKGRRVVLSRAAVLGEQRQQVLAELTPGKVVQGRVTSLPDFGAFVDLGGLEGLVHVSEISRSRVQHPKDALELGQEVEVKVLKVEQGGERISLSMKDLEPDPWKEAGQRFGRGDRFSGRVLRKTEFGLFVEIQPDVEGLLHVSQLPPGKSMDDAELQPGQAVEGWVREVEPKRQRISLSLREVPSDDPWKEVGKRFPEGESVEGTVESIAPFGVFITLAPGITGLLPNSQTGLPRGTNAARAFSPGQSVRVQVLSVDSRRKRISLGREGTRVEASKNDLQDFKRRERERERETPTAMAAAFARLRGDDAEQDER
jgi:small subunit ribosomal protein S1